MVVENVRCNNKRGEELEIDDDTILVSANVSETCGKADLTGLYKF